MGLVEDAQALRAKIDQAADARTVLADAVIAPQVKAGTLTDAEVAKRAALFPKWEPGLAVKVGELLQWDGTIIETLQAHTTQADWTPDKVPALFRIYRTPDMVEWRAGIAVKVNETFTYQGSTYRVLQAHTTQLGWEPPKVPALWAKV